MLDKITVLIPTSPIPLQSVTTARTAGIEKTLKSIRFHLPNSKIIIMADGVRPQVEHRRINYEFYKKELREKCNSGEFGPVEIMEFDTYTQQARMTRAALDKVITPFILFAEHDTDFVTDVNPRDGTNETIPSDLIIHWDYIIRLLQCGASNFVRFSVWPKLPDLYMQRHMFGYLNVAYYALGGSPLFLKTNQYSQWPNVSTVAFYKHILNTYFHPQAIQMMELPMASIVGNAPWEKFKLTLYYPEGNARRFWHREGRIDPETGQKDAVDW